MAVAETCLSHGKTSRTTFSSLKSNRRALIFALKPLTCCVWAVFGLLMPPGATAQIVADPTAAANQRPTVLVAPNNVPLVNIQTPSAAGVSRNTYSQFDVQSQGAILNNSRTNAQTQLGGWVQGNPRLANGGARVILNEVNSNNPSLLRGYVEVAGQRAQVVIANPSGVTCDGCGFINANRATITTGTPIMNGGHLDGFRVQRGIVTITGNGLDARSTDYTDVIARAVQINAGMWANQLKVMTGVNQIKIDPTTSETSLGSATTGTDAAPTFAIDTAQLGGMYAQKITLLATEAGVGVRNAGNMYAGVGDVIITAHGQLQNAGQITSNGQAHIDTQNGVHNTGTVYAQGSTVLTTRGDISNSGVIAAKNNTVLKATGTSSHITSTSGSVLSAGVQTDGMLGTSGNLTLSATQSIAAQGHNLSGADQSLTAQAIDMSGSQTSAGHLSVNASNRDLNLADATIAASGILTAHANQTLRTDRANVSAHHITATAHHLSNHQGGIVHTGNGAMAFKVSGDLDNTEGRIASNGATTLIVGALNNQGGKIQATGPAASDLTLTATADIDNSSAGSLSASGNATITGERFNNTQGLLAAQGQLTVTGSHINNQAGTIGSVQESVSLTAQTGALNNQSGRIEAAKTTTLAAVGIINTDGTVTGKSLFANSQRQSFNNTRGKVIASGAADTDLLSIHSGEYTNHAGLIQGASALTVNTHGQTFTNTSSGSTGGIVGRSTVHVSTGDINNQAGYIGSDAALTLHGAALTNTEGGHIVSSAAATIHASALNNQSGHIQAVGNADIILSGHLNNTGSLVRSGQSLTLTAASVNNTHTQGSHQGLEGHNIALAATHIDNTAGAIRANHNTTLSSSGTIGNTHGVVSAGRTLAVQDLAPHKTLAITNTAGTLIAGQQLSVDSASLSGDGNVLSQGNLNLRLKQSTTNSGQIIANGHATVVTDATLTNQGKLAAGNNLNAVAATIDNQTGGSISATNLTLQATHSHTLTNRGTINASDTVLESQTLNNLGTGKIYGDHIALGATTLTNTAEHGIAPVIAARERLDIGAATITNSEHALLFSGGDLAIGGRLDLAKRATGQASTLNNDSATIEATDNADIFAATVNNTNRHFSITTENLPTQTIVEYQAAGSSKRYAQGTPGVRVYNDESDHLHTPEGDHEDWVIYEYTRHTSESRVASSDPAQITSGGALRITADTVNNDKSRIIAGGTLSGTIGTLNNIEAAGERITTDVGSATYKRRDRRRGRDKTGSRHTDHKPAPTIESIILTSTVYQHNTAASRSGAQIAALSTATVNQTPDATRSAKGATQGSQTITPTTQVVAATSSNAVVRSGGINTTVPSNSLFGVTPNPASHYLIETDPAFTNYRTWLSSDYLLNALSINPALTQKRLGDGFYEQKLIREQVAQLTGRRYLDGYASDEAQYAALMNRGVAFAQAYNLVPGVSLSAAQMAQLTHDIVWLVEKDITLADGTVTQALVPQLYVHAQEGDLQTGGALIAGDNVNLNITGDLLNGGAIAGQKVVSLTAEKIHNLGGRIQGADVGVAAGTDLNNIGGTITANNTLVASAGRDLNVASTTQTQTNTQGSRTNIERVAGLYVTGSAGTLLASAGRDANLIAAALTNQGSGDTRIHAANNLNLGTVTESSSNHIAWDRHNYRSESSTIDRGTQIQTDGNLTLTAGNDLHAKAANVTSHQGNLRVAAGNNVNLIAGEANVKVDEAHRKKSRSSAFSSKTITTRDRLDQTKAQATTLSGKTASVYAGQDINLTGSNVVSDNSTTLAAQKNLNITAAANTIIKDHFRNEKKSGLFSGGGIGITIGTQQQSVDQKGLTQTAAASTVGSTQGDIHLQAGQHYTQTGSDILAPQGDIRINAQKVDINEARETSTNQTESQFKQSGLTLAITSPVISAIQTAQQMSKAAGDTSDPRMKALAAANIAFAGKNAADAIKAGQGTTINHKNNQIPTGKTNPNGTVQTRDANTANKAGGINISASIGTSSSKSKTVQTSNDARGSTVAAGNNLSITASGAGQDSDITALGSSLQAGNRLTLNAQDEIRLAAAQNTADQRSTNTSHSGSIGISFGTDGLMLTVSASGARGKADGKDVTWSNTHVSAGNQVAMTSGGDTALTGAVVAAPQISADVGGNLSVESLQDTSQFASKQQSIGGSVSVGYGKMSGSFSASQNKIKSDFASVVEQSGIRAGDQGFDIKVANNTDLKGGAITSIQAAIDHNKNSFSSGGQLTTSDIQNQASYKATSVGISVGKGMSLDGKLASLGTGAGYGKDKGNASSTTVAAISGIAGNKAARTGDAETGIARIFDADKVQKEINAQVQITQAFGREASKAVASYAATKLDDIKAQQKAEARKTDPDIVKLQALKDEQQKWEEGGAYRIALHTAAGGLSGGVQGAVGAGAGASAAPVLNDLQDSFAKGLENAGANANVAKAAAQLITGITAAGIGSVSSGGSTAGAATAFNADSNNRQLHPTEAQWIKANAKKFAKEQGSITEEEAINRLTQQAVKDVDYLWRAQLSDGSDKSAEAFLASNKQTFTNDLGEQQKLFTATGQQLFRPAMFADTADPTFYKQFTQSGIIRPLSTGLIKELKDSGIDLKNGVIDLAKAAKDNPGLVFGALWNAAKNLPGAAVDGFVETGHAIGEGSAVAFNADISQKLSAIYGSDVAGYQKAMLAIRTMSALAGATGVAKVGNGLTEAAAKAVASKLDDVKVAKAAQQAIADAKVKNNFYKDSAQFESNIVGGIAKANLRLEYEQASRDLLIQAKRMQAAGMSEEQVAQWAVNRRNQLKVEYRELTPSHMLADIEARNMLKYQNPIGPSVEQLQRKGKSWQQIIEGAAKPGGEDIDLSPFGFHKGVK